MRTTVSEHVVESLKNDQGDHMKVRTCTFASQNSKNARLTRHGTNEFSTQKARMDPETLLLMVKSTQPSCTLRHTEHAPLLHSSSSRTALGQPAARKSRLGGQVAEGNEGREEWEKEGQREVSRAGERGEAHTCAALTFGKCRFLTGAVTTTTPTPMTTQGQQWPIRFSFVNDTKPRQGA